ncbi:hypothetical protein U1Q18_049935 [Sarracenia purpurea var. burkii]
MNGLAEFRIAEFLVAELWVADFVIAESLVAEFLLVVRHVVDWVLDLVSMGWVFEQGIDRHGRMGIEILIAGGEGIGGEGKSDHVEEEEEWDEK